MNLWSLPVIMNSSPSTEERVWAVLSHLSALAFGMGILLPVIGWSEQRRKSKYASFQCLQALGYQSLGFTVWILTFLLVIVLLALIVLAMTADQNSSIDSERFARSMTTVFTVVTFGLLALYSLPPLAAAIACGLGKDFRYPILGERLAKYLGYRAADSGSEELIEEREDRWVAAMGHFAAIILLWGMLAPLTAWILQGKRSLFLKFQSMQTLILHAVVTLLYFGGLFVYLFGFAVVLAMMGLSGNESIGAGGMFGFGIFIVFSLIAFVAFLLVPALHILAQWAGYRVLKGADYRYPLFGRLAQRWTNSMLTPPSSAARMEETS